MNARGLAWPGGRHLLSAARHAAAFTLLFVVVYGGADWLTGLHAVRVPVHLAVELRIPLVPAAVWAYMSVYGLQALVPFALGTPSELEEYVADLRWMLGLAGLGFLLIPAETAWPTVAVPGTTGAVLAFADRLNLDHDLVPSLHVALAVAAAQVLAPRLRPPGAVAVWSWAALVAASTVLTHQHHLLDVASGVALARGTPALRRRARGPSRGRAR
jgi:membrane-associated phospholipid phosphatase